MTFQLRRSAHTLNKFIRLVCAHFTISHIYITEGTGMVNVYVVTYSSTRLHNQRIIKQTNKLRLIVIILDATN